MSSEAALALYSTSREGNVTMAGSLALWRNSFIWLLKGLGWACGEAGAAAASLRVEVAPAALPEGLMPLPSPLSCGVNLWVLLQGSGPGVLAVLEHGEDSLCGP